MNSGLRTMLSSVVVTLVAASATARSQADGWGDASLSLVQRVGKLSLSQTDHLGGATRGSGMEGRFMMPIGWGAYYRFGNEATKKQDGFDWNHFDIGGGFSRRLAGFGSPELWTLRGQLHLDFGLLYSQIETHESCATGYAPFSTQCQSVSQSRGGDASGAALGLEARVGGELGVGPIGVGIDVGEAGYLRLISGANSLPIPARYSLLSVQFKAGIAIPF
ncbi:MAG: hypothetical protein NVS3B20_09810 [Polyangiales bacterium]